MSIDTMISNPVISAYYEQECQQNEQVFLEKITELISKSDNIFSEQLSKLKISAKNEILKNGYKNFTSISS